MSELYETNMTTHRPWKKVLSVILSVILAFGTLVALTVGSSRLQDWLGIKSMLSAYAAEYVDTAGAIAVDKDAMLADPHTINLENRDGSNTVYLFSEPISFTNENGNLKTKDISVVKETDKALKAKGYSYSNGQNDYRIHFAQQAAQGVLVQFDGGSYTVAPVGNTDSVGEKSTSVSLNEEFETFSYANAYGDSTALQFYPQLNGVKDEITLDKFTGQTDFAFRLTTENCTAVLQKDGTVELQNSDGKCVQTFAAPFAYDSAYVVGDKNDHYTDCSYQLKQTGDHSYTLTVSVSKDWLQSDNTAYPVTIDPVTSNLNNYRDAGVYSASGSANVCYGKEVTCCFGKSQEYGVGRAYNMFTLPESIKAGAKINSAYSWQRETTGRTSDFYVTPYLVNAYWEEGTVTWKNKPSFVKDVTMTRRNINSRSTDDSRNGYWYKFNIANAVKLWANGRKNYGIVFVSEEEKKDAYNWRAFTSKQYRDSAMRPYTVINYTNDTKGPSFNLSKSTNAWTNGDVSVSISNAKDVGVDGTTTPAGLAAKPYSIATSSTPSYSATTSITYKTNQTKVYGAVVDKVGNATTKTVSITNIDKLAPGAPTVKLSATGWTNQNVTATVRATDAAATSAYGKSGVVFYGYSLTGAKPTGWQTVTQADSATTFTLKNGGTYHFYAKDRAGNISAPTTVQVKIDKSGPEFSVIASADRTQLSVEVSKSTSGVAGYSFDGGTTWDYTSQTEFTKTYDQPQNTWRVLVKDNAGNIADSNGFSSDPPVIYRDGDLVALYGSGDLQYRIDNGEWLTYTGPFSVDHTKQTTIRAAYKNQTSNSVQLVLPADYNAQMAPVHSATDATITYGNAQFDLSRTYMPANGTWFWSTDSRLETVADGVLSVTLPDGSQTAFTRSAQSNIYTNALTDQTVAVYDTDGVMTYALSTDDQTYTYNAAGLLVAISDDAGHSISITRTENRLQLSYGSGDDTLSYTFVLQNDLVQSLTLPDGTKLVYTYKDGALSLVNEDSNTLAVQRSNQQPLGQYTYDSAKRIIKENGVTYTYDEQGRLTAETGTDGNTVTYTYDGTTVTTTDQDGNKTVTEYDGHLRLCASKDNDEETVQNAYNDRGCLVKEGDTEYFYADDTDRLTSTKSPDQIITYTYDNRNRLILTVTAPNDGTDDSEINAQSDDTANDSTDNSATEPDDDEEAVETTYTYSVYTGEKLLLQFTSTRSYDYNSITADYPVAATAFTVQRENDTVKAPTVPDDVTQYTRYDYDGALCTKSYELQNSDNTLTVTTTDYLDGLASSVTQQEVTTNTSGSTDMTVTLTNYTYDSLCNVRTVSGTTESGSETSAFSTTYTYDDLGRTLTANDTVAKTLTAYVYDSRGNVLRQTQTATDDSTDQTPSVTRTVYDGCGRVLQVITDDYVAGEDGLNAATPVDSYADSTKGTLNAYDSRGNLTYERNSQGVVTHFAYSDTNKLVREAFDKYVFAYDYQIEPSELDGQTVSYIRTITVAGQNYATEYYTDKDLLIAKAFANGQALRYNYNEDGDLTAQYHDSDETPFVTYTYDSEGTLQSKTNTDTGLRTVYTGDLTEVYQIASDGTETLYYSYSNEETTDSGKTTRIYSANTLGTEVSRKVTDNTASYTAGSHAFTVQSAEDSANRTATETLTAGDKTLGTTSRTYDEQGRVTAETITYGENQLYLSYQYDDQGRLTYYRQGRDADKDNDAQISRYQYDSKGQMVRENIFFDNDRAGITRTYTYDKRGNITSAKTYIYTEGELTDQTPTKSYTCTYKSGDDVWEDELVNATAIDENSSLLYDANGNPLNYNEAAVRWSAGRQLSKISGVDENGNEEVYASFIYDENGIRTSEQSTEPGMSWDFTTEDGVVTGRQNDNGKNYRFIYDESGRPTAFMLNDALYHYITNQMGDVIGVADADGNLALEYHYDAWGDNFTARPDSCDYDGKTGWNGAYRLYNDNPIKYRSYYFDHAIGMYYLQSRYFHTDINRFFNADDPDIAKQSKDVPVGMNLFAYCNNDPVNGVDPTGYKYSPSKAKAYAEKWWDSDKVGYNHAFGRETNGDCTNFVSACLYAGKLSIMTGVGRKGWHCHSYTDLKKNRQRPTIYQRSHAWAAAQNLYDWLHAKKLVNYTYVLKNRSDVDNVGRILISKPICAAVIFFTNSGKGNKNHAAISGQVIRKKYSFDVFYYAHSVPRNGKKGNKHSLKDYLRDHKGAMIHVCILV